MATGPKYIQFNVHECKSYGCIWTIDLIDQILA